MRHLIHLWSASSRFGITEDVCGICFLRKIVAANAHIGFLNRRPYADPTGFQSPVDKESTSN